MKERWVFERASELPKDKENGLLQRLITGEIGSIQSSDPMIERIDQRIMGRRERKYRVTLSVEAEESTLEARRTQVTAIMELFGLKPARDEPHQGKERQKG